MQIVTVTKPLSVKILGSGNAAKKHKAAFVELPELYQIVDSDSPDIIDICTPPYLHFPQAKEALLSGCHAIVEKPVCGSLAECDELLELEQQTGKKVCLVFQYRFGDPRAFGPGGVQARWARHESYYRGWRGDWDKALGGCLTSHGIHIIDLAIWTWGFPPSVRTLLFDCPDSIERHARIVFDGYLTSFPRIIDISTPEQEWSIVDKPSRYVDTSYMALFQLAHWAFVYNGMLPVTLAQARQSLEVLTAAYYSAYIGQPVTLPILPDHPFYHGWAKAFAQRASQPDTRSPAFQKTP